MKLETNVSLQSLNTLRLNSYASSFARVYSKTDVYRALSASPTNNICILGGGSNILFAGDYAGTVLKPEFTGINKLSETNDEVVLEIGAGENWHTFVTYAVDNGWGGVENLALIPGTVGAAPVQNIAAYGQNFVDVFDSLSAIDLTTGKLKEFTSDECELGYRTSVFKTSLVNRYLISRVRVRLNKTHHLDTDYYMTHVSYDSLQGELESIAKPPYTIEDVYQAVITIRTRKLPDPANFPTCGSFFLNPVVTVKKYEELSHTISELQSYPVEQLSYKMSEENLGDHVKIPAGRLIDELGWRGKKVGNCSVWDKHALIFTHNGHATGKEFWEFAQGIKRDVQNAYGIELESEIVIIGAI